MSDEHLRQELAQAQETIRALQDELERTNSDVMQLTLELEERISEQAALAAENRRNRNLLEAIFETDPAGLAVVVGPELRVAYANPAYRFIAPHNGRDLLDQTYETVWSAEIGGCCVTQIRQVVESGQPFQTLNYERRFEDGAIRYFTFQARRLEWDDQAAALIALWDTTKQKAIEDALRTGEEKFQTITDFTYDWVYWIGPDRQLLYCSPSCERITGHTSLEFLEHPELLVEIVHPEDRERVANHIASDSAFPDPVAMEFRVLNKDGEERWIGHLCQPVISPGGKPLGRRASNRDITESKKIEQALAVSEQRFRSVLENSLDVAYRRDLQLDRYDYMSPMVEQVLGYTVEEMTTMPISQVMEYVHPEDRAALEKEVDQAMRTGKGRLLYRFCTKQGEYRWVADNISVTFDPEGKPLYRTGILRDITAIQRVQAELRRADMEIEVQHKLIEQREHERLQIARDLHDGPIQELVAAVYALKGMEFELSSQPGLIGQLEEIQEGLNHLVAELRAFAGNLRPPTLAKFGLIKGIDAHLDSYREKHPEINVKFTHQGQDGELLAEMPRLAIYRIYQEAMNNILRHAQASKVRVHLQKEPESLILEIKDNGKGFDVPKDNLELIRQGHLGLAGMRERVDAIGGELEISSKPGRGTHIRVKIPLK